MSVDLETAQEMQIQEPGKPVLNYAACITVAGYSFAIPDSSEPCGFKIFTYTQDWKCQADWDLLDFVCRLPVPKTAHNGQYDMSYLTRWGIPFVNYCHDTQYWQQSMTPYIKKKVRGKETSGFYSLQDVSNFHLMDSVYWKDGRGTHGMEYRKYCGTDCHNTLLVALNQLATSPANTFGNFKLSFHRIYSCIVAGMRGKKINQDVRKRIKRKLLADYAKQNEAVKRMTGFTATQDKALLPLFQAIGEVSIALKWQGSRKFTSAGKNELRDMAMWHPQFAHLAESIKTARRSSKWLSTYVLKVGWNRDHCNGGFGVKGEYLIYELKPFGTDTRRLSSSKSNFWWGHNGQNVPPYLREMYEAYAGYRLMGSDMPAAETRCTAYLSRCLTMRNAVEGDADFHSLNASAFFGIPYEEIYDVVNKKRKDPVLILLAKRVNHGANYMMGVFVFIETVGVEMVYKMREYLKLPGDWNAFQVVAYVLKEFDKTYPEVRLRWAFEQALKITKLGFLPCVSGYRPVFLECPLDSKSVLNTSVAFEPQHLGGHLSLNIMHNLFLAELRGEPVHCCNQVHDETISMVPVDADKDYLTALYMKAATEHTPMNHTWEGETENAVLSIPAEEPTFTDNWQDLK